MSIFPTAPGNLVEERKRRLKPLSKRPTHDEILNCFTPHEVIDTPARFVGREEAIKASLAGLANEGTSLLLWGERGCGKSSLAVMVEQIAQGRTELLNYYGLSDFLKRQGLFTSFFATPERRYNVVWVTASADMTVGDVVREIMFRNADGIHGPGLTHYLKRLPDEEEVASELEVGETLKVKAGAKATYRREKPAGSTEALRRAIERYSNQNTQELLIIVDEFDTVKDRATFAPLLKNLRHVRFLLAGVASTAVDLLAAHASIPRHVRSVALKPMTRTELHAILEIGFHQLSRFFKPSASCLDGIVDAADGSPFWCHLLARTIVEHHLDGYRTFSEFVENADRLLLGSPDVDRAVASLPEHPDVQLFEDTYLRATAEEPANERVLLHMAKRSERRFSTRTALHGIANDGFISMDEARSVLAAMLAMPAGPFVMGTPIGDLAPFTFADPNFRRYVALRHRARRTFGGADRSA